MVRAAGPITDRHYAIDAHRGVRMDPGLAARAGGSLPVADLAGRGRRAAIRNTVLSLGFWH
jgi:hypothetical protein